MVNIQEVYRNKPLKDVIENMNNRYLYIVPRNGSHDPHKMAIADVYMLEYLLEGKYIDLESRSIENVAFSNEELIDKSFRAYLDFTEGGYTFLHKVVNLRQVKIARKLIQIVENTTFKNLNCAGQAFSVLHPYYWSMKIERSFGRTVHKYNFINENGMHMDSWRYKILTRRKANGSLKQKVLEFAKQRFGC